MSDMNFVRYYTYACKTLAIPYVPILFEKTMVNAI